VRVDPVGALLELAHSRLCELAHLADDRLGDRRRVDPVLTAFDLFP
jgi:hypothetical protein